MRKAREPTSPPGHLTSTAFTGNPDNHVNNNPSRPRAAGSATRHGPRTQGAQKETLHQAPHLEDIAGAAATTFGVAVTPFYRIAYRAIARRLRASPTPSPVTDLPTGRVINESGVAVPQSAAPHIQSSRPMLNGPIPPGWTQNDSGLIVPGG